MPFVPISSLTPVWHREPGEPWIGLPNDLAQLDKYWGADRVYHHTAPISAIYGLHEALAVLFEEGLDARIARHAANAKRLWDQLTPLGLKPWAQEGHRLPQLNTPIVPAGVDEPKVRKALLETDGIEIGGGLGELKGKIWRVGLMGASSTPENVDRFVVALAKHLPAPVKA